jgi:hypothetical protein
LFSKKVNPDVKIGPRRLKAAFDVLSFSLWERPGEGDGAFDFSSLLALPTRAAFSLLLCDFQTRLALTLTLSQRERGRCVSPLPLGEAE